MRAFIAIPLVTALVAAQGCESSSNNKNTDAASGSGLPADYAFLPLIKADAEIEIHSALKSPGRSVQLSFMAAGKEALVVVGRDAIRGLGEHGVSIRQKNEGSPQEGNFQVRVLWTPEPIACYRDNQLLGIWDPGTKKLRPAQSGEAPKTWPSPLKP